MSVTRGQLWPTDRFGRVVNAGDRASMTPLMRRVARAIADAYRGRLGSALHSVYLSGPATRGVDGPAEAFGVLRRTASPIATEWLDEIAGVIRARWPGAGLPELVLYDWHDLYPDGDSFSWPRFRVGVNSVCLSGRDLSRAIAPQRLSVAASNAWIVSVRERISEAAELASLVVCEEDILRECHQMGRFLLAAGFALVMPHEAVYTEDPDLQRDFIMLNHPERADDIAAAYELLVAPSCSPVDLMFVLDGYGAWPADECDRWLDRHNPQRITALPA